MDRDPPNQPPAVHGPETARPAHGTRGPFRPHQRDRIAHHETLRRRSSPQPDAVGCDHPAIGGAVIALGESDRRDDWRIARSDDRGVPNTIVSAANSGRVMRSSAVASRATGEGRLHTGRGCRHRRLTAWIVPVLAPAGSQRAVSSSLLLARSGCEPGRRWRAAFGLSAFLASSGLAVSPWSGWLVRVLGAQTNSSACRQSSNRAPGACANAEYRSISASEPARHVEANTGTSCSQRAGNSTSDHLRPSDDDIRSAGG
jgi:hypothetical protein